LEKLIVAGIVRFQTGDADRTEFLRIRLQGLVPNHQTVLCRAAFRKCALLLIQQAF
jgi:hypothetical protein